mmetsp:Transcript_7978/g.19943  ORF Transcript_7978/g.19943 Transcript_7978/m.19943 type:complete len:205 (+) Transcript_7978:1042-1656(+)
MRPSCWWQQPVPHTCPLHCLRMPAATRRGRPLPRTHRCCRPRRGRSLPRPAPARATSARGGARQGSAPAAPPASALSRCAGCWTAPRCPSPAMWCCLTRCALTARPSLCWAAAAAAGHGASHAAACGLQGLRGSSAPCGCPPHWVSSVVPDSLCAISSMAAHVNTLLKCTERPGRGALSGIELVPARASCLRGQDRAMRHGPEL